MRDADGRMASGCRWHRSERAMSVIDAVVSAAAILFAMAAAVFPRRVAYALPVALPLLVFGCLIQFVLEDFYWQMVPCYLAIVAATVLVASRLRRSAVTE